MLSMYAYIEYVVLLIIYTIVVDIEIADRPHDDPDYMEDAIQNMIDNGS